MRTRRLSGLGGLYVWVDLARVMLIHRMRGIESNGRSSRILGRNDVG
jgi:hypothetical protein